MLWSSYYLAVVVSAYPASQPCYESTTSGSIHRTAIERSTSRTLAFAGVACGGTITAGTTQTLTLSDDSDLYTIEAVASAGTSTAWGLGGDTCSNQRMYNTVPSFTVPPSGTVTMRVAWASGRSTVYTSQDCAYTVSPAAPSPSCNACPANQYMSGTSPCVCTNCPTYSTSPAESTTVTACSCIPGYSGSNGGKCKKNKCTQCALVLVNVTLPMTQMQFKEQEGAFIEAIAAAAGALKEDVLIKSVREVASRRGGYVRRAGTSATSLQVSVEIKTNNTAAVMMGLTQNSLAAEMVKEGLPAPTSFATEVRDEVHAPLTVKQMPDALSQDQGIESKVVTFMIVASVVGALLLLMRCACVFMSPCGAGSPKVLLSAKLQKLRKVLFYSNRVQGDIESSEMAKDRMNALKIQSDPRSVAHIEREGGDAEEQARAAGWGVSAKPKAPNVSTIDNNTMVQRSEAPAAPIQSAVSEAATAAKSAAKAEEKAEAETAAETEAKATGRGWKAWGQVLADDTARVRDSQKKKVGN